MELFTEIDIDFKPSVFAKNSSLDVRCLTPRFYNCLMLAHIVPCKHKWVLLYALFTPSDFIAVYYSKLFLGKFWECKITRVSTESGKSGKFREFENWSGNIRENQKISWMSGKSQGILLVHVIKKKMTLFGNSYLSSKCTY